MAKKRRRILYGWRLGSGAYCVSAIPPDLPQLPFVQFPTIKDADREAEARKSVVVWCGTAAAEAEIQHQQD